MEEKRGGGMCDKGGRVRVPYGSGDQRREEASKKKWRGNQIRVLGGGGGGEDLSA